MAPPRRSQAERSEEARQRAELRRLGSRLSAKASDKYSAGSEPSRQSSTTQIGREVEDVVLTDPDQAELARRRELQLKRAERYRRKLGVAPHPEIAHGTTKGVRRHERSPDKYLPLAECEACRQHKSALNAAYYRKRRST